MPIYEYVCADCNHKFELIRKINDQSDIVCPECNSKDATKMTSRPSFHLKGSGWYKDGYSVSSSNSAVDTTKAKKTATPAVGSKDTVKKDAVSTKSDASK